VGASFAQPATAALRISLMSGDFMRKKTAADAPRSALSRRE
jgi:hypothetical protein